MNWLSTEEIKRRAEISDEEALHVSIEEWERKCNALEAGIGFSRFGSSYCGLCHRKDYLDKPCSLCVLQKEHKDNEIDCCYEYQAFCENKTLPNAQAMLNRLYLERGKRYGKGAAQPKELRHGDCGIVPAGAGNQSPHPVLADPKNLDYNTGYWLNENGEDSCAYCSRNGEKITDRYNIFDDLERNSKDLEEFEVEWPGGYKFSAKLLDDNCGHEYCGAKIKIESGSSCYTFKKIVEIHQKLGQLIATAKRKAEKDC